MENKGKQVDLFDAWKSGKNALNLEKQSTTNASSSATKSDKKPENTKPTEVAGNAFAQDAATTQFDEAGAMSFETVEKPDDAKTEMPADQPATKDTHTAAATEQGEGSQPQVHPEVEIVPEVRSEIRTVVDYDDPEFDATAGAIHASEMTRRFLVANMQVVDGQRSGEDAVETAAAIAETLGNLSIGNFSRSDILEAITPQPGPSHVDTQPGTPQPSTSKNLRIALDKVKLPVISQPGITQPNTPASDAKNHVFTFGMNMRYTTDNDAGLGKLKGVAVLNDYDWAVSSPSGEPTVFPCEGKSVYGLVYHLDRNELHMLNLLDCVRDMVSCVVDLHGTPIRCMFFLRKGERGGVMDPGMRVSLLQAFNDALNHGMPAEYVDECFSKVYSVDGSLNSPFIARVAPAA